MDVRIGLSTSALAQPVLAVLIGSLLSVSLSPKALAQSIYRTTDPHGNVIFTDNPQHGGTAVKLSPVTVVPVNVPTHMLTDTNNTTTATPLAKNIAGPAKPRSRPGQPFMPYDTFTIDAPENDHALPVGAAGNLQVQLGIQPALRDDHHVRLVMDGQVSQTAMHATTFMLSNLDRGSHQLQAELLDASGTVRHRTPARVIHVQRASINLPHNPKRDNG